MEKLLVTALEAAEAAAGIHLRHFRRFGVDSAREKAQSDFVTQVDLEAQAAAITTVRRAFPNHWILAEEESGGTPDPHMLSDRKWPEGGEHLWIIDPLDGTTNFLHGHPMFCASVAVGRLPAAGGSNGRNPGLSFHGCLEAGAVVAPRTGERWWAQRGGGAWKNGQRLSVSEIGSPAKALIGTGFPFKEPEIVPRYADQLKRVLPNTGGGLPLWTSAIWPRDFSMGSGRRTTSARGTRLRGWSCCPRPGALHPEWTGRPSTWRTDRSWAETPRPWRRPSRNSSRAGNKEGGPGDCSEPALQKTTGEGRSAP